MASKSEATGDTKSFIDTFRVLTFDQKKEVMAACQGILQEEAENQRADLLKKLAELDALTGKPSLSEQGAERDTKARGSAPIKYYKADTGDTSTGRGGWKTTPWVKAILDAGEDIEKYRVGPHNPLPENLQ